MLSLKVADVIAYLFYIDVKSPSWIMADVLPVDIVLADVGVDWCYVYLVLDWCYVHWTDVMSMDITSVQY